MPSSLRYACRNLSAGGIGILHSSYVHAGTPCTVHIPLPTGTNSDSLPVRGKVVRCRHVRGTVHEVGIRFDEHIDLRRVMNLDYYDGRFTLERVEPARLAGSVLHLTDSFVERRIFRLLLRETGLDVISPDDPLAGLARAREGFEAIVVDQQCAAADALDMVRQLRGADVQSPILLAAADASPRVKASARAAGASAVLVKPLSAPQIARALGEFLLLAHDGPGGSGALTSTLTDSDTLEVVNDFVAEVHQLAVKLKAALEAERPADVRRIAQSVLGTAPSLGFATLGQSASAVITGLERSGDSVRETFIPIRALIASMMRTRPSTPVRPERPSNRAA